MKRYIRSSEILPNKKIQVGMYWNVDGHAMTVTWISKDRKKCKITEEWIAEDTYQPRTHTDTYDIRVDEYGTEYAKASDPKYADYDDIGVYYSTAALNYPYVSDTDTVDDSDLDDTITPDEDFSYDDWEDDDYYTPSATAGDYSPSNPWDSPGYSVRDFI